ncbi:MAG: hypothetical protein ACE366_06000 [Bradymonadia bacterium]
MLKRKPGSVWAALLMGVILSGCSAVGYHTVVATDQTPPQVDAVSGAGAPAGHRPMVILVVVDGLRADTLGSHLETIEATDLDPPWPSGLALLRRNGFALGRSTRTEAPIPAYGLAPLTSALTGHMPGVHGLPGSAFFAVESPTELTRYDFEAPFNGARIFYDQGLKVPSEANTLLAQMVRVPTLMERLSATHRSAAIFSPLARGAWWLVPDRRAVGVRSILRDRSVTAVMPIFDRGVRDASVDLLLNDKDPLPDLVVLNFGTIMSESCFQDDKICSGAAGDLATVQRLGMRTVDGLLWKVMRAVSRAHPERQQALTVMLVGTGGMVDRTTPEASRPEGADLPAHALGAELARWATTETCKTWLTQARARGALHIVTQSGFAQIYLPPRPMGSGGPIQAGRQCLSEALDVAVEQAPWLAGAAWMPASEAQPEVKLDPTLLNRIAAYRRASLPEKIKAAMGAEGNRRTGDALLFAHPPWRFTDEGTRVRSPYAYQGTLEDDAVQVPFLVASKALPTTVSGELKATQLELADVTPTVLSLLKAPESAFNGLSRQPALKWRADPVDGDQLELVRADRQLKSAVVSDMARAQPVWRPATDHVMVGLSEGAELRAPDSVDIRLGEKVWRWTYDDAFPEGAPCQSTTKGPTRTWTCRFDRPEKLEGISTLGLRRDPTSDEEADGVEDFQRPIIWSNGEDGLQPGPTPEIACVASDHLKLASAWQPAEGLDQLRVALMLPGTPHEPQMLYGEAYGALTLSTLSPTAACKEKGPAAVECQYTRTTQPTTEGLKVPFTRTMVDQLKMTRPFLISSISDPKAPPSRWLTETEKRQAPKKTVWLALDQCDASGSCQRTPFMTVADYRAALAQKPCP